MECSANSNGHDHVINVERGEIASTSVSLQDEHSDSDEMHSEDRPSTSRQNPTSQSLSSSSQNTSNSRNASFIRRGDNHARRQRSPLNSGLWISVEVVVNVGQILAAIIVLSLSRHERTHTPLFAWIIGYTCGCAANLPHLYWRYIHRNSHLPEQESEQARQNSRLNTLVDHFKMGLDCFFAVWFVVGNVWIFGGHSSSSDAPNLYRLCIAFLTFSCIGYAMPFIVCATICCCFPCIISFLRFREDLDQGRGATTDIINTLPTYKFKSRRNRNKGTESTSEALGEDGILGSGTKKERVISAEDAECCICLAKYSDNDKLRELPCSHFFHAECVDKWLKINALCPLCKSEIDDPAGSLFGMQFGRRHTDRRAGRGDAPRLSV